MIWFIAHFDTARDYFLHFTITHTHSHSLSLYSVHSYLHCCMASNDGCSITSGFPNCPRPKLSASHSNSSPWLNPSSPQTNYNRELLYHWQFAFSQFILVQSPLRIMIRFFFRLNPCGHSLYVTFSLMRERVCQKSELLYKWRFTTNQFILAPRPSRLTTRVFFFNWILAVIALTKNPLWWMALLKTSWHRPRRKRRLYCCILLLPWKHAMGLHATVLRLNTLPNVRAILYMRVPKVIKNDDGNCNLCSKIGWPLTFSAV